MDKGIFRGVGVGPGDPELLTLKAVRMLKECEVWAVPRTHGRDTLALDIASRVVEPRDKTVLYLDFPMRSEPEVMEANHRRQAAQLAQYLDRGRSVACLTIGDTSLYSTCAYLSELLLADGYVVETVPGVPSFCACAAVLNRPLTDMRLPLHIFPASFAGLEDWLAQPGGKVLMKSGSTLTEVRRLLDEKGLSNRAAAVTDCGLPGQKVFSTLTDMGDEGYFTTILIRP